MLLACCALLAIIFLVSAGLIILSTYDNRVDEIRSQLEKLSAVLADRADQTFEALDVVGRGILAELPRDSSTTPEDFIGFVNTVSFHQRLSDKVTDLPTLDTLAILDSKGQLINSSRALPVPRASASDRDYFQALSQPNAPDIYISRPVVSHITGTWMVILARRINSPRGEFLGVIVAAMETKRLEAFFSSVAQTAGDAISMLRTDGVLLARYPLLNNKIGTSATANEVLARLTTLRDFRRLTSVWDGRERYVATTRSSHYPLLINVSTDVSTAFERWDRQTWFLAAATALLELGIVAVGAVGTQELRGRLNLAQERAEKGRLVAEAQLALARERENAAEERSAKDKQFRVAIETMRQGLCMFDGHDNLVIFNRRVATKLGIPLDRLTPGLALSSLMDLLQHYGVVDADGAARVHRTLKLSLEQHDTQTNTEQLLDGRILSHSARAISDEAGWILTCEDATDRYKAEQRLLHISMHDPLTDLVNRMALRTRVEAEARRVGTQEICALLYVDLDGFKEVNDTLGHPTGDAILIKVAERLLASTRSSDTVARIGGDEFVIIETSTTHPDSATHLAERLIDELRQPFEISDHAVTLGASIGISFIEPGVNKPDLFIKKADLALYEAKKDGGNCYRVFEPRLEAAALTKSKLSAELKEAVAHRDFVVHYQPLVSVRTCTVCGFEALVRWRHPTRGLVAPGEFIALAEEIGLINQIGEQVLFQACADAASWPSFIKIAVNLSPKQFGEHNQIVEIVQDALQSSELDPGRLELEITETILLNGSETTMNILRNLKSTGVSISMDDFGTGYSSLSYLQKFPFDKVKIDQSFIQNMRSGCEDPIIHAIMALCRIIGLRTTAEGVETSQQFEQLRQEGCDEVQGYLFGRPVPADEIPAVIQRLSCVPHGTMSAVG